MHASSALRRGQHLTNVQIQMLWNNFAVGKAFFDTFISVETGKLFHLSFVSWVRLCYMVAVYCKAVFFEAESQPSLARDSNCDFLNEFNRPYQQSSWDSESAAKEANFQQIGGTIEQKIRIVAADTVQEDETQDAMTQFASCMKGIIASYERQLQKANRRDKEDSTATSNRTGGSIESGMAASDMGSWDSPATGGSSTQPVDDASVNLGSEFPANFHADAFENIVWESLMNDFTILPQP